MHSISPPIEDWIQTQERLDSLAHSFWQRRYRGHDRRESERRRIVVMAQAIPHNDIYEPISQPPLNMFTTDLSAEGAGLVYVQPLEFRYLALTLRGEGLPDFRVLAQVVRCVPSGVDPRLYNIGTRFL